MNKKKFKLSDISDRVLSSLNAKPPRRISLTQQVENRLKCALILGFLAPGQKVVTKDIANSLNMSITPVREALVRLSSYGALDVSPSHAFLVPKIQPDRLIELMGIRKLLELPAITRSINIMSDDDLGSLVELTRDLEVAHLSGEIQTAVQLHWALRLRMFSLSNSPELMALITQLWVSVGPSFHFLYGTTSLEDWPKYYFPLRDALLSRNADSVIQIFTNSIDSGLKLYMDIHGKG
ncbi:MULTISPECIES: GntR family transcriptional regulator [Morganellaceae]|uniref:GntR family transcriptional regulator n=1 Tax=Morganellaceae TaxID=1903414 RepID=UPI0023492F0F|nr:MULTISPECIES: GntR family transcriptional regulator [unclassified Providencia]WOB81863.1 GntR family transcriptional regulator [Providencia sp. PROV114]